MKYSVNLFCSSDNTCYMFCNYAWYMFESILFFHFTYNFLFLIFTIVWKFWLAGVKVTLWGSHVKPIFVYSSCCLCSLEQFDLKQLPRYFREDGVETKLCVHISVHGHISGFYNFAVDRSLVNCVKGQSLSISHPADMSQS